MYSPSAELNAYILDYKARKSLQNSPYSTPTKALHSYSCDSSSSKSWLQEVLPQEYKSKSRLNMCSTPVQVTPINSKESSVAKWLNDLDEKIAKRFPNRNELANIPNFTSSEYNKESDVDEVPDSDKTLELLMTDPQTGLINACHCESYDSHPNVTNFKMKPPSEETTADEHYCDCSDLKASAWVDDVINEDICSSCMEKDTLDKNTCNSSKNECCYQPKHMEQSVNLPDGYKLFEHKAKHGKQHSRPKSRKKQSSNTTMNSNQEPTNPLNSSKISPETENIMKLLERAIDQLQEVKVAVEDNTVSAITSDISTTSQALSELPND